MGASLEPPICDQTDAVDWTNSMRTNSRISLLALVLLIAGCARFFPDATIDAAAQDPKTLSDVLAQGETKLVAWFYSVDAQCAEQPGVFGKLAEAPRHGNVRFVRGRVHPNFAAGNPRAKCNARLTPTWFVLYEPEIDFTGDDRFVFDEIFADDEPARVTVHITVR